MKDGITEILGKTITGLVVKERAGVPRSQVFLVFSDNTHFEFYCGNSVIHGTGGIWPGGINEIRAYMSETSTIVLEAQLDN